MVIAPMQVENPIKAEFPNIPGKMLTPDPSVANVKPPDCLDQISALLSLHCISAGLFIPPCLISK